MRKYIIGTGWFSSNEQGYVRQGGPKTEHPFTRSMRFSDIWAQLLFRYAEPNGVVRIDSASPVKPVAHPRIKELGLDANYQLCGNPLYTGWMRGFCMGAAYAWNCDADYIYVEQDCLVLGGGWVDKIYETARKHNYGRFVAGPTQYKDCKRVSFAIQVSLVYIPYGLIMPVLAGIASSKNPAPKNAQGNTRAFDEALVASCGVPHAHFDFGYGQQRPIDWDDPILYAQRWTAEELKRLAVREKLELGVEL